MKLSERFTGTTRSRNFFFRKLTDSRLELFRSLGRK